MGAPAYDTDALLDAVRRDSFMARSDDNWTDARILAIGDDCLISQFAPYLKTAKQNWFETDAQIALVANQQRYDLPEEAMWFSVDNVLLQNVFDGVGTTIAAQIGLASPGTRGLYDNPTSLAPVTGIPLKFYLEQTQMVVLPTPGSVEAASYQLLVPYYRRPAQMIKPDQACVAATLTAGSLTVVTSAQPSYFTDNAPDTYRGHSYVDVYSRFDPHTRKFSNLPCTINDATHVTFFSGSVTTAQVATIAAGDTITVHGTSPFPDIPPEGIPFLRKLIIAIIEMAQKDAAGLAATSEQIMKDMGAALRAMSNRTDGAPRKLTLRHAGAAQAIGSSRRWWPGS